MATYCLDRLKKNDVETVSKVLEKQYFHIREHCCVNINCNNALNHPLDLTVRMTSSFTCVVQG